MAWTVETLNDVVDRELEDLPPDLLARLTRLFEMAQDLGLENLREPHVKQLDGKFWEFRAKGKDGLARAAYVTRRGRRIIILRAFVKKTQKTPKRELDLVKDREKSL
jgi:phage-related protein